MIIHIALVSYMAICHFTNAYFDNDLIYDVSIHIFCVFKHNVNIKYSLMLEIPHCRKLE